jgi:filamentous hemagglutinin family protein
LPTGANVVAGQAGISSSGSTLTVRQSSDRAVVDWQTFNVGRDASVRFEQPSASAAILNRVLDSQPSQIHGRIVANGQVFLTNPNGVYFSPTASVDVGALVASTHRLGTDDFMAGRLTLERNGSTGSVTNAGRLQAELGGYIALLAPEVRNEGIIIAKLGTVALAAGEAITLHIEGSRTLAGLSITPAQVRTLVENRHLVQAPGGLIILSAKAAEGLHAAVINSGRLEATGFALRGGRIVLEASERVENTGVLDVSANAEGPAGSITLTAPIVSQAGELAASDAISGNGGLIAFQAQNFTQLGGARVLTQGFSAGGTVIVQASESMSLAGEVRAEGTGDAATGGSLTLTSPRITTSDTMLSVNGAVGGGVVVISAAPPPAPAPSSPLPPMLPGEIALLGLTQISARGRRGEGGHITLLGDQIALRDTTRLDASGETGGGLVRVGGGWQGGDNLYQATTVLMERDALIDVSARQVGAGGTAVLWSDAHRAGTLTRAYGTVLARGGAAGGDGGRIETSSWQLDVTGLRASASAAHGQGGLWLLDPYNVIIAAAGASGTAYASSYTPTADSIILASDIAASLDGGTNVTITTGTAGGSVGDITVTSAITKSSGNTDVTLTLQAANSIVIDQAISHTGGTGKLNVALDADNDNGTRNGVGVILLNSTISTGGGALSFGSGATLNLNGVTTLVGGDVYVGGGSAQTLSTGGGNVTVNGEMLIANTAGLSIQTGGGNVTFAGLINAANSYQYVAGSVQWNSAFAAAKSGAGSAIGDTYLATITSRLESAVASRINNYNGAWLGGHRGVTDGTTASYDQYWRWVTGPEGLANAGAGTIFYTQTGNGSGTVATGLYANWSGGEPNNCNASVCGNTTYIGFSTGETALQFDGNNGTWNDKPDGIGRSAGDSNFGYTKETNLAASPLTINAGSGTVTFGGAIGQLKALSSLSVTAGAVIINGGGATTEGAQTYKATGNIVVGANDGFQTTNSALTFWSDADASGSGYIQFGDSVSLNTANGSTNQTSGGGAITLAGGSDSGGAPSGYATSGSGDSVGGVSFGTSSSNTVAIYSGGGNILLRGRSSATSRPGLYIWNGGTINSGAGTISLTGEHTATNANHGLELGFCTTTCTGTMTLLSSGAGTAITLAGTNLGNSGGTGIQTWRTRLYATGTGGIAVTGSTGSASNKGINFLSGTEILAASGPITIDSGARELALAGDNGSSPTWLGAKAGVPVTTSSSAITLSGDTLSFANAVAVTSTGALVAQSSGTTFSAAQTFQNLTLTGVSDLTLGKTTNTANLSMTSALAVAGPISIYAGRWTQSAALSASTSSAIAVRTRDDIIINAGSTITSAGGNIVLNSDSDASGTGGITINGSSLVSNGGNITLGGGSVGDGSGNARGLTAAALYNNFQSGDSPAGNVAIALGNTTINAGGGGIALRGQASAGDGTSRAKGVEIFGRSGWTNSITTTGSGAISIEGIGYANSGGVNYGFNITNSSGAGINTISTQTGNITLTGTAGSAGNNNSGIMLEGASGSITIASTSGSIALTGTAGSGASAWDFSSSSIVTIGGASTSGNITLNTNTVSLAGSYRSTGSFSIAPRTASTTIGLNGAGTLALTAANFSTNFFDGFAGITVGRVDGSGTITTGALSVNDPLRLLSASGNVSIGGALNAATNTLTFDTAGTVTQTAAITAGNLALLGGGAFTLSNTGNNVATLAGVTGILSYIDADALELGSVGSTNGIAASGAVSIATQTGNLSVTQALSTSNTTATALVLNAGKTTDAGTATGGDLFFSGSGSAQVGAGGTAILYTGSVAGSTGLTALIGSGSGRFRYNSDEATTNFNTALSNGLSAIYREQSTVTVTAVAASKTYDGLAYSGGGVTYGAFANGDSTSLLTGTLVYGGSSQGAVAAGSYTLTPSGLSNGVGYALSFISANLIINRASATITGNSGTGTYSGVAQTVNGYGVSGLVNAETASVLTSVSAPGVSGINAGSYTHTPTGSAIDGNYNLSFTAGTLTIGQAPLTATAVAASKTYDGLAYSGGNGVNYSGFVNSEASSVLGGTLSYSGTSQGAVNAGSYLLTPGGLTSSNYALSFISANLIINPPPAIDPPAVLPPVVVPPTPLLGAPILPPLTALEPVAPSAVIPAPPPTPATPALFAPPNSTGPISPATVPIESKPAPVQETGGNANPVAVTAGTANPTASASTSIAGQAPTASLPGQALLTGESALVDPATGPGAIDALIARALPTGLSGDTAVNASSAFAETLARALAQGAPPAEALARANNAMQTSLTADNISPQARTAGALASGVSGAFSDAESHGEAGSSAFSATLSSLLQQGLSLDAALVRAEASAGLVQALARADASPAAALASGNADTLGSGLSAPAQALLGRLLASGVAPDFALVRAISAQTIDAGMTARDAANPATGLAQGELGSLSDKVIDGAFERTLSSLLARGVPVSEALIRAQRQEAEEVRLIAQDNRLPGVTLAQGEGQHLNASTSPEFDALLADSLRRGLTPDAALKQATLSADKITSRQAQSLNASLASGRTDVLATGGSASFRRAFNAALARGLPPEEALTVARRAETANAWRAVLPRTLVARAGKNANLRAQLSDGTRLPGWLQFDAATGTFIAPDVPEGALPLTVSIRSANGALLGTFVLGETGLLPPPR